MEIQYDRSFKCINCGTLNLVSESQNLMQQEPRQEWSIKSTISARRKFNQLCGGKGLDFNDGLEYLIALYEKEVLGKTEEISFGVPGTAK